MESSQFSEGRSRFDAIEQIETQGASCDAYRVKVYGKLHFLKCLKPAFLGDIRYQEAFRKEFETGYRLEHPNLVRYISLSGDGILMEYVDGDTLAKRLADHPDYFQSKKNCDKFLRQLLDVVGYLHAHQVLHLDLKPDNILLTRINDDVKLVDLGCCYTDTFTDTQGHTNRFAAPEQLPTPTGESPQKLPSPTGESPQKLPSPTGEGQGEVSVDVRTDIYAIGKILELLPNHHTYSKVVHRCTQRDPAKRYQSVADLQRAVFPKKRSMLWSLLLILVVVLTAAYFIFTSKKQPSAVLTTEPQQESSHQEKRVTDLPLASGGTQETLFVEETVQPVAQPSRSVPLGPVKSHISKDEDEFINQPHLRIITSEEFIRYKHQLDEYYSEVNAFLDDSANYQKYPSHVAYQKQYQAILRRMRARINADEWFHPLYESPIDPFSSYTRAYKSEVEHRAFLNGNKLP